MPGLPAQIKEYARALREATPICPSALLHLGKGAATRQAMSRLARSGKLMRLCYGVCTCPPKTRFGRRAPGTGKTIAAPSAMWGETIVPSGGATSNYLGLTTPVRAFYLTWGSSRTLHCGSSTVELRHAQRWQPAAPNRKAEAVVYALAWLRPNEVEEGPDAVLPEPSPNEIDELAAMRTVMPIWMAEPLNECIALA